MIVIKAAEQAGTAAHGMAVVLAGLGILALVATLRAAMGRDHASAAASVDSVPAGLRPDHEGLRLPSGMRAVGEPSPSIRGPQAAEDRTPSEDAPIDASALAPKDQDTNVPESPQLYVDVDSWMDAIRDLDLDGDKRLLMWRGRGPYDIPREHWEIAVAHDFTVQGDYSQCDDPAYARRVVRAYLEALVPEAVMEGDAKAMTQAFFKVHGVSGSVGTERAWARIYLHFTGR